MLIVTPFVLNSFSSIKDIAQALDFSGRGYIPVCRGDGVLVGIVTDGDLRRAFISGGEDIASVINTAPKTASVDCNYSELHALAKGTNRGVLILVDDDDRYKGVFDLSHEREKSAMTPVVIMAGGLGKRLGKLTEKTPKPMLTVSGKPVLQIIIEKLAAQGFKNISLAVNYLSSQISEFFATGENFNVNISYIEEKKRMGTAGALSLIDDIPEHPIIVMNADLLLDIDYSDLLFHHYQSGAEITVVTKEHSQQIEYGVVSVADDSQIKGIQEKPSHFFKISAGVYVVSPSVLAMIPPDSFFDMPELVNLAISSNRKCCYYNAGGFWLDIGREKDLNYARKYFMKMEGEM